jgi:hypothetical protein
VGLERKIRTLFKYFIQAALTTSAAPRSSRSCPAASLAATGALSLCEHEQRKNQNGHDGDDQSHQAITHIETLLH